MVAAKNAVAAPIVVTKAKEGGLNSNRGEVRRMRKTPAVTIVAA